jgi:hypothetical protein
MERHLFIGLSSSILGVAWLPTQRFSTGIR